MRVAAKQKPTLSRLDIIERKYGKDVGVSKSPELAAYLRRNGLSALNQLLRNEP